MPRRNTLISLLAGVVFLLGNAPVAPPPQDTPSELESNPDGWVDLLAQGGKELKGWTRLPIPPKPNAKRSDTSQWSIDPKSGYLVCEGNGGHEWLRWDEVVGGGVFHVEFRYTPVTTGAKNYNSGIRTVRL